MKKRFLLGITGFVLVFLTVLIGCTLESDGLSISGTEDYHILKLSDPVVTARAFKGVIVVGWNWDDEATGYRLTRQDGTTGEVVNLAPATGTSYIDVVGSSNSLVDGRTYTYTVTAMSNNNPARTIMIGADRPVYYDGVGKASVTARIPANGTQVDVPAPGSISLAQSPNGSELIITWTDAEVFYNTYTVSLNKRLPDGTDDLLVVLGNYGRTTNDTSTINFSDPRKFASLPLIGGELAVKVTGTFADLILPTPPLTSFYRSNTSVKTYPGPAALKPVASFTAIARQPNSVALSWSKVDDATGYDLYYAPYDGVSQVTGDWQLLDLAQTEDPVNDQMGARHDGVDLSKSKQYRYVVIAKNATSRSSSAIAAETTNVTVIGFTDPLAVAYVRGGTQASTDVTLFYELDNYYTGYNFTIEKAEVEAGPNARTGSYGSNPEYISEDIAVGDLAAKTGWTAVSAFVPDYTAKFQYVADTVSLNQAAAYRLLVTDKVSGVNVAYSYAYVPKQDAVLGNPFTDTPYNFEWTRVNNAPLTTTGNRVALSWNKQFGETYTLSMVPVSVPYKPGATWTTVSEVVSTASTKAVFQASLNVHQSYLFKVVITAYGNTVTSYALNSGSIDPAFSNVLESYFIGSGVISTGNTTWYAASLAISYSNPIFSDYNADITAQVWRQELNPYNNAPIGGPTSIGPNRWAYGESFVNQFTAQDVGKKYRYWADFYLQGKADRIAVSSWTDDYDFLVAEPTSYYSWYEHIRTDTTGTPTITSHTLELYGNSSDDSGYKNAPVVVQVRSGSAFPYTWTTVSSLNKTVVKAVENNFSIPLDYYYVAYTPAQLNALSNGFYRVAYIQADGIVQELHTFSVSGSVSW